MNKYGFLGDGVFFQTFVPRSCNANGTSSVTKEVMKKSFAVHSMQRSHGPHYVWLDKHVSKPEHILTF